MNRRTLWKILNCIYYIFVAAVVGYATIQLTGIVFTGLFSWCHI